MAPKASTVKKSWGSGGLFQSREAGSLALIILTPILAFPYWYTCAFCKGDPVAFYNVVKQAGFWPFVRDLFFTEPAAGNLKSAYLLDSTAWKIYLGYAAFELVLQRWMPGKEFRAEGAKTRSGHVPVYKANGMQSYLISILCLLLLRYDATSGPKYIDFNPAVVFDNMGKLLGISNILAFTLCFFLETFFLGGFLLTLALLGLERLLFSNFSLLLKGIFSGFLGAHGHLGTFDFLLYLHVARV
jgi:hypothetical protein